MPIGPVVFEILKRSDRPRFPINYFPFNMEPLASAMESTKGFANSIQDFVDRLVGRLNASSRRRPIEILKRLQREAFSDIMKLRDRQDKLEKILSFHHKHSKESSFQEAVTHVRGWVDVSACALWINNGEMSDLRSVIRTGIDTQFSFESAIRGKDMLVAELSATGRGEGGESDMMGTPVLSLTRVMYKANVSDWFSLVAIPVGARCRDIGSPSNIFYQGNSLTDYSCSGPPLLNEHSCSGIGLTMRKSNVVASLGQFVSDIRRNLTSNRLNKTFSTFGEIVCHLPRETRFSVMGLHRALKPVTLSLSPGPLSFSLSQMHHGQDHSRFEEYPDPNTESYRKSTFSEGCIALMLESSLDENTKFGGWVEMNNLYPRHIQWSVNLSDDSKDELGWGLSLGGTKGSLRSENRFLAESHVKVNIGNRFNLCPGVVHVMDGNARITAFMLRSHWSF